jgi:hypothetical protein
MKHFSAATEIPGQPPVRAGTRSKASLSGGKNMSLLGVVDKIRIEEKLHEILPQFVCIP